MLNQGCKDMLLALSEGSEGKEKMDADEPDSVAATPPSPYIKTGRTTLLALLARHG